MNSFQSTYPFSAIVAQDQMKKALLLNAINPRIGGVLIKGEKGTAKSTAARSLANLLPEHEVVDGCPFGCDPHDNKSMCLECHKRYPDRPGKTVKMKVVELPVSATEDKVVGSLDIEHALRNGERKFDPGILAHAHRNILYVDEVNLLNDHIVDVLLDVAAMGVNVIEREGVSFMHPSSFILIGTMNPEEGELRPQLLDRFGLCVDIEGIHDVETRVDVIRRRMQFENDPGEFGRQWERQEQETRDRIIHAQNILPNVEIPEQMIRMTAQICEDMEVDGHRADITMMKTAATIAAYHGRTCVIADDIQEAATLVLSHRMRRRPFSEQQMDQQKMEQSIRNFQNGQRQQKDSQGADNRSDPKEPASPDGSMTTQFSGESPFRVNQQQVSVQRRPDTLRREGNGRRSTTESTDGKYVRSRIPRTPSPDIAIDATIRAAAPFQKSRPGDLAVKIEASDIREKVRERKMGNTILFVVDASGSMGARQRMSAVKGAILSLLIDAYQKRDRVGMIAFRGDRAEIILPPTSSVERARVSLQSLPVGGRTPLAHGMFTGLEVLKREMMVHRDIIPRMILISDGRANVSLGSGSPVDDAKEIAARIRDAGISSLIIDSEQNFISLGLAQDISEEMGGRYLKLEELGADQIAGIVKGLAM